MKSTQTCIAESDNRSNGSHSAASSGTVAMAPGVLSWIRQQHGGMIGGLYGGEWPHQAEIDLKSYMQED